MKKMQKIEKTRKTTMQAERDAPRILQAHELRQVDGGIVPPGAITGVQWL